MSKYKVYGARTNNSRYKGCILFCVTNPQEANRMIDRFNSFYHFPYKAVHVNEYDEVCGIYGKEPGFISKEMIVQLY